MAWWHRIESMACSVGLRGGLEARVADPLWMLSRQWQVAEFRGDDAAQPAAVRVSGRSAMLRDYTTTADEWDRIPEDRPLEAVVEETKEADFGGAGLHASARAGRRLARMLRDAGLGAVADVLRREFPLALPDDLVAARSGGREAAAMLARRGIDGARVARTHRVMIRAILDEKLAGSLTEHDLTSAETVINTWRAWHRRRGGVGEVAWSDWRLEHSFSARAATHRGRVGLKAAEYDGGHLDWYTFDLWKGSEVPGPTRDVGRTALPTPVRYQGMPASRWWELEDGDVNFGDIDAGPADLARLLVAEFATVYGDDWFVVPLAVPVGSLTEITGVQVIDTFGGRTPVPSTALADLERAGPDRVWRLFELRGDEVGEDHPAPWLLVAPSLAGQVEGPVLERVQLARDEGANLAWGIERLVEGPLGRAVDRAKAWDAARPPTRPSDGVQPAGGEPDGSQPPDGDSRAWTYRLEAAAPPWWIPLLPERVSKTSAQVLLRRARMQAWERLGGGPVGPQSVLLDPHQPRWIHEEEVPRSGVRVERRWQFGRWHDGSFHVWLQRRKRPGRGEQPSGARWDLLE